MNQTSEVRLRTVHPAIKRAVEILEEKLLAEGSGDIIVVQAARTYAAQDELYAQGRTAPGTVVTNARGGYSWHCFSLAVDLCPIDQAHQPDWNASHPVWQRMIDLGTSLGMVSGKSFHDLPHFQMTGRFPITPTDEVRTIFESGGVDAVWAESGVTLPENSDITAAQT